MIFSVLDKMVNRHHHPPGNQESVDHGAVFEAVSVVVDELRSGGSLISAASAVAVDISTAALGVEVINP